MTRLMIVGASGMLGHKLWQTAATEVDVIATLRARSAIPRDFAPPGDVIEGVDCRDFATVARATSEAKPHVIVNCAGVVKQSAVAEDDVSLIDINSVFPRRLARLSAELGIKLIHVSTDCVFSGQRGRYSEGEIPDARDLYGLSKYLGEPPAPALTLRTSIIGRELKTANGLVEWFLSNRGGRVDGYTRAIFSGLTTIAFSQLLVGIVKSQSDLVGVYHVAAEPIAKSDLLALVNSAYGAAVSITPSDSLTLDRSLDGARFGSAFGFAAPPWPTMIADMVADKTPYDDWRV